MINNKNVEKNSGELVSINTVLSLIQNASKSIIFTKLLVLIQGKYIFLQNCMVMDLDYKSRGLSGEVTSLKKFVT